MSIESVMPSSHLILCRPLLLLPPIPPSIRVFSNDSTLHMRWPKYWSLSFSIILSKEHPGLESSPTPQFKSINSWALSSLYSLTLTSIMTTGKTIALTKWTCVGRVTSLLFNMLSGLVIAFLPRSKRLLISWLQSPPAVILEPPKIKSVTVFIVSPSICHEVMGPDAMILVFWMLSFKPTFPLSSFT